ncbi:Uncharacterized protein TCM_011211 [Theobroma cacao]|uniref:Uncharacterized protein n=1 Tax=Theobroma cacao TaxID=3641 RepID=A0A061E8E9_THECC|nr:Uncharacterized protein TCM_011211 [Theobroma cacao]
MKGRQKFRRKKKKKKVKSLPEMITASLKVTNPASFTFRKAAWRKNSNQGKGGVKEKRSREEGGEVTWKRGGGQ